MFSSRSLTPSPGPASPLGSPKRTVYANRAYKAVGSGGNNRSASSSPNHGYAISPVTQHYPQSPLVLPASPLASNCPGAAAAGGPPEFPTGANGSLNGGAASLCLGGYSMQAPPSPRTPDSCSPPPSPVVPLVSGGGAGNGRGSGEPAAASGINNPATHSHVFDVHLKYNQQMSAAAPAASGHCSRQHEQQEHCHMQHSSSPTTSPFLTPIKSRLNSLKNSFLGSPTFHRRKHPSKHSKLEILWEKLSMLENSLSLEVKMVGLGFLKFQFTN